MRSDQEEMKSIDKSFNKGPLSDGAEAWKCPVAAGYLERVGDGLGQ